MTSLEQISEFEKSVCEDDEEEQARVGAFVFGEGFSISEEDLETYCATRVTDSVLYHTLSYEYLTLRMRKFSTDSSPGFRRALETFLETEDSTSLKNLFYKQSTISWLLDLSKASEDDYHLRVREVLVNVSNRVQDARLSRILQYICIVAEFEKMRTLGGAAPNASLKIARFEVSTEPFGNTYPIEFTSRSISGDPGFMPNPYDVLEIQFGTTQHTKHSGIFQSSSLFRTVTVFLNDGSQYTRFEKMGESEAEINDSRRSGQSKIEQLALIYPVTFGGNQVTSSGRQVTVGMGWWF